MNIRNVICVVIETCSYSWNLILILHKFIQIDIKVMTINDSIFAQGLHFSKK